MFYGFFCATLPELVCGTPAEISLKEFDDMVQKELSAKRFAQLVSMDGDEEKDMPEIYRELRKFDHFLKLRIAEKRAEKLNCETELPTPEEIHTEVDFALPAAANADDPRERELLVDKIRWMKIDDLEGCHNLDFTTLCAYRLRLDMLEKYRKRSTGDGNKVFEDTVARLASPIDRM
ncbi:MAG: DUF2764 family protein [Lentisphaeria bacterium]|nr:DUF2764 family protein [Lentisphaeria bacterium]